MLEIKHSRVVSLGWEHPVYPTAWLYWSRFGYRQLNELKAIHGVARLLPPQNRIQKILTSFCGHTLMIALHLGRQKSYPEQV
jgi:hypothetical protein